MDDFLIIQPRIKMLSSGQIEVSFNGEETIDNKTQLKKEVGEVVWANLDYESLEKLLSLLACQIQNIGLNVDYLYNSVNTQEVLNKIKQAPELRRLFSLRQPIWEGYTTEVHALGVATTLVTLAPNQEKAWLWEVAGLLHDLGKVVAAFFEHDAKRGRRLQDQYNYQVAQTVLEALGFALPAKFYMLTLIDKSNLPYRYVSGGIGFREVKAELAEVVDWLKANAYQTTSRELMEDLAAFWLADAADYSVVQCFLKGIPLKPSFCSQFVFTFSIVDGKWKLTTIRPQAAWNSKYKDLIKRL